MAEETQRSRAIARDQEIQEVFAVFASQETNTIPASHLATVVRSLRFTPSEAEITSLTARFQDHSGNIAFDDFQKILSETSQNHLTIKDVIEAFKVFDTNNTGMISAAELKRILTSMGEKLSEEEVDDLLTEANVDDHGMLNYHEFAQHIML